MLTVRLATQFLPFLFYLATGLALSHTLGTYRTGPVIGVSLFWLLSTLLAFKGKRDLLELSKNWRYRILSAGYLLFAIRMGQKPRIQFLDSQSHYFYLKIFLTISVVAAILTLFKKRKAQAFILAMASLVAARVLVIFSAPSPKIDVFTVATAATKYFLNFQNPYVQKYVDVYGGASGYPSGMLYPPGVLLWVAPFQYLFGDIRHGMLFADCVVCFCIYKIARKLNVVKDEAVLFSLLWFSFPVALFILGQAWVDTLLIMWLSLFLLCWLCDRRILSAICLGVAACTKQYSIFVVLFSFFAVFARVKTKKEMAGYIFITGLTCALVLAPFAVWDFEGFYHSIIEMPLAQDIRFDSFSLTALFHNVFDYAFPPLVSVIIYGVLFCLLSVRLIKDRSLRSWSAANVSMYGAVFLFGKQAFCNYYQLLSFFMLTQVMEIYGREK